MAEQFIHRRINSHCGYVYMDTEIDTFRKRLTSKPRTARYTQRTSTGGKEHAHASLDTVLTQSRN